MPRKARTRTRMKATFELSIGMSKVWFETKMNLEVGHSSQSITRGPKILKTVQRTDTYFDLVWSRHTQLKVLRSIRGYSGTVNSWRHHHRWCRKFVDRHGFICWVRLAHVAGRIIELACFEKSPLVRWWRVTTSVFPGFGAKHKFPFFGEIHQCYQNSSLKPTFLPFDDLSNHKTGWGDLGMAETSRSKSPCFVFFF